MTKRSWLVGLLVGLVLLMGASPVLAGYMKLGVISGNDSLDVVKQQALDCGFLCTFSETYTKYEFDDSGNFSLTEGPGTVTFSNLDSVTEDGKTEVKGGDWQSSFAVAFFAVKAGNNFQLWAWDGTIPNDSGIWSTSFLDNKGTSHISFYTAECSNVPIPGAVWLLGSGLLGLIGVRRKKD